MAFLTDKDKQILLDRYLDIEWCDDVTHLRCVLCNRVAISHYVSSCHHLICHNCREIYSDGHQQLSCPQCPGSITILNHKDFDIEVNIHQLRILCPNKNYGCIYADQLRKIPSHLLNCGYTREKALPAESAVANKMDDVFNQLSHLSTAVGRLNKQMNVVGRIENQLKQMKRKMNGIDCKINVLTNMQKKKRSEKLTPLKAETFEWTVKDFREEGKYESEVFHITGYEYDIKARIEGSMIGLQFKDGDKNNEFPNIDDVFVTVKYIVRDQSDNRKKEDQHIQQHLQFGDGCGQYSWIADHILPDELYSPPYVKDNCLKVTITIEPPLIDRIFIDDGVLVWRLNNYKKRKSVQWGCSNFSPCFYTSPRGYRARVGIDVYDQSISVEVQFLAGKHDATLSEDFNHTTTVTLINQTDPSKNLVNSREYSGVDMYDIGLINSKSLKRSGFITDDSLLLKVVIEPLH